MDMNKKSFAFKLAARRPANAKWKAREGVALAGCTDPSGEGDYRYSDNGVWC